MPTITEQNIPHPTFFHDLVEMTWLWWISHSSFHTSQELDLYRPSKGYVIQQSQIVPSEPWSLCLSHHFQSPISHKWQYQLPVKSIVLAQCHFLARKTVYNLILFRSSEDSLPYSKELVGHLDNDIQQTVASSYYLMQKCKNISADQNAPIN